MGKKGSWLSALRRVFTTTTLKDRPSSFTAAEPDQKPARESKKKWTIGKTKQEGDSSGRFFHLQRGPSSVEKILGDAEKEIQRTNLLPPKQHHDAYQHHQHSHHHHQQQQQKHHHHRHDNQPREQRPQPQPQHQQWHNQPYEQKPPQQPWHQNQPPEQKPRPPWHQNQPLAQKPQQPRHQNQLHHQRHQNPQHPPPHQQLLLPPPLPLPRASVPTSASAAKTPMWPLAQRRFNAAATRIQTAYRGHMARRGYRTLRGLVRLQVVMRGPGVRRQTASALRSTQTLVRVQAQVRWMRLQMAENRRTHHHNRIQQHQQQLYLTAAPAGDRDGAESILSKWSAAHLAAAERRQSGWDDSLLPREEIQARVQRKVEAIAKRERALSYHYNNQLFKAGPMSAYSALAEIEHGGFPIWWGWVDKHQNHHYHTSNSPPITTPLPATASNYLLPNPPETPTKKLQTPAPSMPNSRPGTSKPRRSGTGHAIRDDESLTSCPPLPSYMAPTFSAKAKVREAPSPTPTLTKRRFSFGLTSSLWSGGGGGGSFLFAGKGKETPAARPQSVAEKKHRSMRSIGEMSIDSAVSLPVGVGRSVFK